MNPTDSVRSFDFGVFLRLGWIIILCAIVGGGAGYVYVHNEHKVYSATAELLFGNSSVLEALGLDSAAASSQVGVAQATDQNLVGLPVIAQRTGRALGAAAPHGGFSVRTASSGSSNLVEVTATSQTPSGAALVANTYARQFIKYSLNRQRREVQGAISALQQRIAAYPTNATPAGAVATLRKSLYQLQTLSASEPLDVSVAQSALVPTNPSGPHTSRDVVLGLLMGLVIGLIFVVVVDWFDPRLHAVGSVAGDSLEVLEVDGGAPTTNGIQRTALRLVHRMRRSAPAFSQDDAAFANGVFLSGPGAQDTLARRRLAEATADAAAESGLHTSILRFDGGSLAEGVRREVLGPSGRADNRTDSNGERPAEEGEPAADREGELVDPGVSPATVETLAALAGLIERRTPTAAGGRVDVYAASARAFVDDDNVVDLLSALRALYSIVIVDLAPLEDSSADIVLSGASLVVVVARLHYSNRRAVRHQLLRVTEVGEPALLAIAQRRSWKQSAHTTEPTKPAS